MDEPADENDACLIATPADWAVDDPEELAVADVIVTLEASASSSGVYHNDTSVYSQRQRRIWMPNALHQLAYAPD